MATVTLYCPAYNDVTVYQDTPTTNYYGGYLMVGTDGITNSSQAYGAYGRTLVKFDLSSLAGVTINSAYLRMHCFWTDISYGAFTVSIHKGTSNYTPSTVTWNTQPSWGSAIATQYLTATGVTDSDDFAASVQASLASGYISLCLNDDGYDTPKNIAYVQGVYDGTAVQLIIDYTLSSDTTAHGLATVCGASDNGTSVRGSSATSSANDYIISAGGSTITPTTITQSTNSSITFNPGSGAQVGRITVSRTWTWSKVSGIAGTLTNTTSNPCTLNCSGTGTYTIQCLYWDPYTGTVTKQQAITVQAL